jgi:RNA polymerase sigma-70 factor (ECF subfamily)
MTAREQDTVFEEWMKNHEGILFKGARSFSAQEAEQDDLVQEIRLAIWKGIPNFDQRSKASSYIYRIALNRAVSWQRGARAYRNKLDRYESTLSGPDTSTSAKDQQLERVYAEIRNLNEGDRSLILLQLDGFGYSEIAETLGISESNVGVRLNRIKNKLTEKLKG